MPPASPASTAPSPAARHAATPASTAGATPVSSTPSHTARVSTARSASARATVTTASSTLPTTVEGDLLRCIRMDTLLSRAGVAFQSSDSSLQNYEKSFETTDINDFISHDWASSRISKLIALCLIYNLHAAMAAEILVGVVLGCLQYGEEPILPGVRPNITIQETLDLTEKGDEAKLYGRWCSLVCPWVFLLFFLFWQDIRKMLGLGVKTCFLDKYCIDQTNAERKKAGILRLAGFLRCSERIVILWTPRYLNRLWCTYELASWLYLQKSLTSVHFESLAFSHVVMCSYIGMCVYHYLVILLLPFLSEFYWYILGASTFVGFSYILHQTRHNISNVRAISEQLKNFSITSSQCFCCTVGHRHNGQEIPCDRDMVYATIAHWFSDSDGGAGAHARAGAGLGAGANSEKAALARFDTAVRLEFAPQVLQKVGVTYFPFIYAIAWSHVIIIRCFDILSAAKQCGLEWFIDTLLKHVGVIGSAPWLGKLTLYFVYVLDKKVGIPRWKVCDYLLSAFLTTVTLLCAWCVAIPFEFLYALKVQNLPMVLAATLLWSISLALYYKEGKQWCRGLFPSREKRTDAAADPALPAQVADAVPFDAMSEGTPVPPPCRVQLRAVRMTQDPDSNDGESQAEPPTSARSTAERDPVPPRSAETLRGAGVVRNMDSI